jgi:hypothetical protein
MSVKKDRWNQVFRLKKGRFAILVHCRAPPGETGRNKILAKIEYGRK